MSETERHYELMFILAPNKSSSEREEIFNNVKKDIEDKKGKITHTDEWPLREFTYPIKKYTEGYYYIINFTLESKNVNALDKLLRLNTDILRHMIVLTPDKDYHYFVYEEDKAFYLGEGEIEEKKESDIQEEVKEIKKVKKTVKKEEEVEEKEEVAEVKEEVEEEVEEKIEEVTEVEEEKSEEIKEEVEEEKPDETEKEDEKKDEEEKEKSDEDRLKELDEKLDQLLLDD